MEVILLQMLWVAFELHMEDDQSDALQHTIAKAADTKIEPNNYQCFLKCLNISLA